MDINLNPIEGMSREIREWLVLKQNTKTAKELVVRNALKSLALAVMETRAFTTRTKNEDVIGKKDLERELANLWREASLDIQTIDPSLAARCFDKAEYWLNPTNWDDNMIQSYNISLDSMSDALRAFLAKNPRKI
jgi:hypothetical protein